MTYALKNYGIDIAIVSYRPLDGVEEEFRSQNGLNAPLPLTGVRIKTLSTRR
ncbi:hypothetical protein [Nostoc commune]|uniref:hypothetical protein n=1 Tax=Nostoc commune TaxID=1178 RepID=UPI0020748910|nr:hypothetical protein [Nostoc commune]